MNYIKANTVSKNKFKSKCIDLFDEKNQIDTKISDVLQSSALWEKTAEGEMVKTHPWKSTFGSGIQQLTCKIDAHTAQHILDHFNNIEDENPSLSRRNRSKHNGNIKKFSRDMISGNWHGSAPIIFEEGVGTLLDGQNRFEALVKSAREICPEDISNFSIEFPVIFGAHRQIQNYVDQGSKRTLKAQAVINGLIDKGDSIGGNALLILQGHLQKSPEGKGFDIHRCTNTDVFSHWCEFYPNTGMTYEDICRQVARMTHSHRSAYELHLGHQICLVQGLMTHQEETELFLECITAENEALDDLREKGIDTNWVTDAFSSVKVCRQYLKSLYNRRKKHGARGGSVKMSDYSHMLYFIEQFINKKKTVRPLQRILTCDPQKASKAKYVCLFPQEDVEDPIQKILDLS